jgi:proline dehydrogenase
MDKWQDKVVQWLNEKAVEQLPKLPDFLVRRVASRYVVGESIEDAVQVAHDLDGQGVQSIVNRLGEHVTEVGEARAVTQQIIADIGVFATQGIRGYVSVKPSQVGLGKYGAGQNVALENLREIERAGDILNVGVGIDAESFAHRRGTRDLWWAIHYTYPETRIAVQSYDKSAYDYLSSIIHRRPSVRICKGIYVESSDGAFQRPGEIDGNYRRLVNLLVENHCHPALATHDEAILRWATRRFHKTEFTIEMLRGVADEWLGDLADAGFTVFSYLPFGPWEESKEYSLRRMKENPKIAGYVIKNTVKSFVPFLK